MFHGRPLENVLRRPLALCSIGCRLVSWVPRSLLLNSVHGTPRGLLPDGGSWSWPFYAQLIYSTPVTAMPSVLRFLWLLLSCMSLSELHSKLVQP